MEVTITLPETLAELIPAGRDPRGNSWRCLSSMLIDANA